MQQDQKHIGRKLAVAKRRLSWSDAQVFKHPRLASKPGGSKEWAAVEEVLRKLYEEA